VDLWHEGGSQLEDKKARPWTFAQVAGMARALPGQYAGLPYLSAGTGMRQGEMFGLAVDDVVFPGRRPFVRVHPPDRIVTGVLCFAPVKNNKQHDVPLSEAPAPILAEHIRQYPPRAVCPGRASVTGIRWSRCCIAKPPRRQRCCLRPRRPD
jgi:integrase